MERTVVVGDVHGCLFELQEIVQRCGWQPGERLVLAGDLVAKGPDSAGVLAFARQSGAFAVLGNHDAHVLKLRESRDLRKLPEGREPRPEHQQVADTLSPDDWGYLETLPTYLRLGAERPGDAETIVVHAGCVPGVAVESQEREHLINLRSIKDDGTPTKKLKGRAWASLWAGPERIVFGHDALRGLQQHPFATGLDTGCVYGQFLTALILPERRLVQVRARRPYVPL